MEKSKFEGLTRDNVAFRLKGKFQASFASKVLDNFGEPILHSEIEYLCNPQPIFFAPYLICHGGRWITAEKVYSPYTRLQISDLVPFLEYLGCKPKITKETLDQIDQLHAEETTDYVKSNRLGPDEPMHGRSDED